ncbi:FkbM family methyltransferase [Alteriqipengyuania lutimaris]|uniref:Methyltransferase FkbM domain-containing protein n=1 Tax=Alteriqipengyuania lutimaris TaxID=1538146 RepID=A0A395LII5_9SPHN|nr:FkbM family methyltransferase [Alteriqipengyuania lutimaris]MBB3034344.1 hypothetical protein [Alteriqipengyuania lutimaris]RDS76753.1 hypothetical protein DL238_03435 [Alteriqipengyuania lutimaris]
MLKETLLRFAHRNGINLSRNADEQRVRDLIARFRPVETDIPLVRVGGDSDGGYLVPDDLDGLTACFSPGVDTTATFERDMLARGIPCFLADASVEGPPIENPLIDFERKFVGVVDKGDLITLDSWVNGKIAAPGRDMILQMDIEGAELPVLLNCSDEILRSFRIIVLELHSLTEIFQPTVLTILEALMDRLGDVFHVVHLHPNNCFPPRVLNEIALPPYLEVTLLRKDRSDARGYAAQFPHPLDRPNVPELADYDLPAVFRGPKT